MKEKKNLKTKVKKLSLNYTSQQGITLIALVVTIVVLLILAGISLNLVLGNNGIISKAKDARNQTEKDKIDTETALNSLYDEMMVAIGENTTDQGSVEESQKVNFFYTELPDGSVEITKIDFSNCNFSTDYYMDYTGGSVNTGFKYFQIKLSNNTLEIPSNIDGKVVKKVNVTDIEFPEESNLGEIGTYSKHDISVSRFDGGPITIKFGDTIEEINSVFGNYNSFLASVRNVIVSRNLKVIGANAFKVQSSLSVAVPNVTITIPSSNIESIGENAFYSSRGPGTYYDITVNFSNGLNLTIPEDKWGAPKILVNGVEQ